jgi:hypothetical protein
MTLSYDVFVPLRGLKYSGGAINFAPGLKIDKWSNSSSFDGFKRMLSKDEWDEAISTKYWLYVDWNEGSGNTPSELMNLVLLSLWLVKPNRIEAKLRFKIGKGGADDHSCRTRVLDRMQWISDEENEGFSGAEMQIAANYFKSLTEIYSSGGRLSNAMVLTLNGCWSIFWQASLISHAAAVEAILTYSKKGGLTKRLAITYACLTEKEKLKRDEAYAQFVELYNIRSDAIHGRIHNVGHNERLPALSRFQASLRILWHKVLESKAIISELEKPDEERELFLCNLQNGYTGPSD